VTASHSSTKTPNPPASASIQVRVSGVSALREIIGKDKVVGLKSGNTLSDLLEKLEEQYGSAYRDLVGERMVDSLKNRFNLIYNGDIIPPTENLGKVLSDGDELVFFQLAGA
jgi:molybdopterin converting factor small subunit